MVFVLLLLAALLLAYANGANDNFKGVATLFGSYTTKYKGAIAWATITTFLGSIAAIFLAHQLIINFSGKGLVPQSVTQDPLFILAVASGAGLTVLTATIIGMPISTTHSLVGALVGGGLMAAGSNVVLSQLWYIFLIPLLVSPFMAALLSGGIYYFFHFMRLQLGVTKDTCVCVKSGQTHTIPELATTDRNFAAKVKERAGIDIAQVDHCEEIYKGQVMGLTAQQILDFLHYISAGMVSFARGLNDTPKIVGMLVLLQMINIQWSLALVGVVIAVGGLLNARKVAKTMSHRITPMNSGQGFTANLMTSLLVTTASTHGMPVSTTHVSVGSIFGIGGATRQGNTKMIGRIISAWVITLPMAGLLSAGVYLLISYF
jgi:PiT family inorganic phosphate transporter